MNKIITTQEAQTISKNIKAKNKTIVLTGGCFDILHIGHIKLLEESKKQGNYLFVLLENDASVKKLKGNNRPINSQLERAKVLEAISYIDYIIILPDMNTNKDWDELILKLNPSIITTTKGNPQAIHNKRQAMLVNAKIVFVDNIENKSTTRLAKIISENFK